MRTLNLRNLGSGIGPLLVVGALVLGSSMAVLAQKKDKGGSSSSGHSSPPTSKGSSQVRSVQRLGGNNQHTGNNHNNGSGNHTGNSTGTGQNRSYRTTNNNNNNHSTGNGQNRSYRTTNNNNNNNHSTTGTGQNRTYRTTNNNTGSNNNHNNSTGRSIRTNPNIGRANNTRVVRARNGSEVHYSRSGRVTEVHTARGVTIYHGAGNYRRIVAVRPDHSRVVVYRNRVGYVQRPFAWRGHEYVSRTYYFSGRPYALYYRGYPYRGIYLNGYAPYYYWRPAFYGWAYNPWYSPISYRWGWFGSPWYGYYGYYFNPYPSYPSASFWLTDFLFSTSLSEAYSAGYNAGASSYASSSSYDPNQVVLTPEVKNAIAAEVQNQIALENSESQTVNSGGDIDPNSSGLPRILAETSPAHPRTFLVGSPIDVTDPSGEQCTLTPGDVLRISNPPGADATSAYMEVMASKRGECSSGTTVSVSLEDLQEMQNYMRAGIDQGLQDLQKHQNGLPTPPASAEGAPTKSPFAPIAPPADPNVSNELQQESQQADAADQSAINDAGQGDGGQAESAPQVNIGQTVDQVEASLGMPKTIAHSGPRTIYVYPTMKVTFVNGRVTDIQ